MNVGRPAGHEEMRRHNLLLILGSIGGAWPIDKADLAKQTGLSWGSVTSITAELLQRGLIRAAKTPFAGRGRNPAMFTLRKDARFSVGIDLGRTMVRVLINDLEGATVDAIRERSPITPSAAPEQVIAHCSATVQKLLRKHRIPREKLLGIGIGISGLVDAEQGVCQHFAQLPQWTNLPLARLVATHLRQPVMLDRSGNCIALAELNYGAALRLRHAICFSLGDELSAGFVFNGNVYQGAQNLLGEIGRVVMTTDAQFRRLVERLSNRALLDQWRKLTGESSVTAKQLHDLAMAGNAKAEGIFIEFGSLLGVVIGNLVNLLNPQRIVLGGRLATSRPLFEKSMQEAVGRTVTTRAQFDVQSSQLGEMDVTKGAATLLMARAFGTGEGLLTKTPATP